MAKKETKIYKNVWKPEAEDVAKKFGFIRTEDVVRKNVQKKPVSQIEQI